MRFLYIFFVALASMFGMSEINPVTVSEFSVNSTIIDSVHRMNRPVDMPLTMIEADSITAKIPIVVFNSITGETLTPTEIVRALLNFLGGLLTTIILYFLHKWFPNIFTSRKIKDYPFERTKFSKKE